MRSKDFIQKATTSLGEIIITPDLFPQPGFWEMAILKTILTLLLIGNAGIIVRQEDVHRNENARKTLEGQIAKLKEGKDVN